MKDLARVCMGTQQTLRDAMLCIDRSNAIALVVDGDRRLLYTISDGDLRRAVLQGLDLDMPITKWAEQCATPGNRCPTTAPVGTPPAELLQLMQTTGHRYIPLIDEAGRVVDLALFSELTMETDVSLSAVVMAGGFGTRLRPLTDDLPKPMLPLGDCPLMEHIVNQLRDAGIRQVKVTTHYKPEAITSYFGDGQNFGVNIDYLHEEHPLGTAGALGLMPPPQGPLLVMNGDILSRVNFRSMLEFHRECGAMLTLGVRLYEHQVPYGVIESDGVAVKQLTEKPTLRLFVNAGIYLLEPEVYAYIRRPVTERFDMTDLIKHLLNAGERVINFPINEYWRDIGQHADYEHALEDMRVGNC
jgi:dTDP-glucose pyrophosphorylase